MKKPRSNILVRYSAYFFLAPTFIVLAIVYLYPVLDLIRLSHKRVISYDNIVEVGFSNFQALWNDPYFKQAVLGNLKLFITVPVLIFLSIIIAALLFEGMRGWKVYRSIVFLPYVLAIPVVSVTWRYMLRPDGLVNSLLGNIGLSSLQLDWLGDPRTAMLAVAIVIVWKELGFGIIVFLARLLSAPLETYEAARIDGANWFQILWYITVPELYGVMQFYGILELITMLSWVFAYIYSMTGGGPANSTQVLEFFIYRKSFGIGSGGGRQLGMAAAVSTILLGAVVVFMFGLSWVEDRVRHRR